MDPASEDGRGPPATRRVLVADGGRPASVAFADWLRGHAGLEVHGPSPSIDAALQAAASLQPHVILIDFHPVPISVGRSVALFRAAAGTAAIFILTHDTSNTLHRRCREAGADGVFHKTSEIGPLLQALLPGRPL